jgi:hypothetical protein
MALCVYIVSAKLMVDGVSGTSTSATDELSIIMITEAKHKELRAKINLFDAWVDTQRNPKNGWASYTEAEIPKHLEKVSNDERSQVETYEFVHNQPDKYTCYVKREMAGAGVFSTKVTLTTWTGQTLGYGSLGKMFWCGKGIHKNKRYQIRFTAINGVKYKGIYYAGSGDYCHVTKVR